MGRIAEESGPVPLTREEIREEQDEIVLEGMDRYDLTPMERDDFISGSRSTWKPNGKLYVRTQKE